MRPGAGRPPKPTGTTSARTGLAIATLNADLAWRREMARRVATCRVLASAACCAWASVLIRPV